MTTTAPMTAGEVHDAGHGYRFKPWRGQSIAAGDAILSYLDAVIEVGRPRRSSITS